MWISNTRLEASRAVSDFSLCFGVAWLCSRDLVLVVDGMAVVDVGR